MKNWKLEATVNFSQSKTGLCVIAKTLFREKQKKALILKLVKD